MWRGGGGCLNDSIVQFRTDFVLIKYCFVFCTVCVESKACVLNVHGR